MASSKDKKKKRKKRSLLGSAEKRLNAGKPADQATEHEDSKAAAAGSGASAPSEDDGD